MKNAAIPTVIAVFAGVSLSGCSTSHVRADVRPLSSSEGMLASTDVEAALVNGRAHMDAGRYGLALTQFRNAIILDPSSAAAQNGLAIAYDVIGRPDLARRYFEQAMALAPEDEAYRRNYARLMDGLARDAQTRMAAGQGAAAYGRQITTPIITAEAKPAQAAVIALRTIGGHARLQAVNGSGERPRLALSQDGQSPVRLVTLPNVGRSAPAVMSAKAVRTALAQRKSAQPVWHIVTDPNPLAPRPASLSEKPMLERTGTRAIELRTSFISTASGPIKSSSAKSESCTGKANLSSDGIGAVVLQLFTGTGACRS